MNHRFVSLFIPSWRLVAAGVFAIVIPFSSVVAAPRESVPAVTEVENDCVAIDSAQSNAALSRSENWAKKLTTFQAQFTQESSAAALGASEQSGGQVFFANPGRMRWQYAWPEKQDFVITNDIMRLYQPAMKQLLIDSAKVILSSDLPVAFLSGLATVTEKFSLVRGCKIASPGLQTERIRFELTPKAKGPLTQLHLITEQPSGRVTGSTIIDESDNITTFAFSRIVEGAALKNNQFEIDVPAGTDIQDNRHK